MFRQLTDLRKSLIFCSIVYVLVLAVTFLPMDGQVVALVSMFMLPRTGHVGVRAVLHESR